jgi:hypothetical protein
LGRHKLEPLLIGLPVVDQVLLVDTVAVFATLMRGTVIADRTEQNRQSCQPLLAIDDEELLHTGGAVARAGREDQRPDEVRRVRVLDSILGKLRDVIPQASELRPCP